MQGIIISKNSSNINSSDPRNIVLDTRESGGMKKLPTMFFHPEDYTELYQSAGPIPGTFYTYGRIRIPHDLGFPPAFSGYVVAYSTSNDDTLVQTIPTYLGTGAVTMYSTDEEVVVEGCPIVGTAGGPYYVTVNIFLENLESETV